MPFAPHVCQQDLRHSLQPAPLPSFAWRSHPKGESAFIVALVTGAHLALLAAMLHIPAFRSTIAAAPVFVRFIEPAAPPAKASPPPEAAPKPELKPVPKPELKPLPKPVPKPAPLAPPETNSVIPPQPEADTARAESAEPVSEAASASLASSGEPSADALSPKTIPVSAVRYIVKPDPVYPALSKRYGEEGTVMLRVLIDTGGKADTIAVFTSSGHSRLDEAARQAVRRARFQPHLEGQRAIPVWVLIPIAFNLEQ